MSRSSNQDRTLRTLRFGFPSGDQASKWWPSVKGASLSRRTRWVRLAYADSRAGDRGFDPAVIGHAGSSETWLKALADAPDMQQLLHEICDHSIPKRFKYFRNRSASFVLAFRPREA